MKLKFLIALLTFSMSLFACGNKDTASSEPISSTPDQNNPTAKNVSIDEAKKMIAEKKDIVILDVRTPGEVSQGVIANATIIDFNGADFEKLIAKLDKNKPTLVYCKAGGRSKKACDMMTKLGFKELYNLEDGYDSWK